MSKAHDPHWRYIALRLDGRPVSRRALQNALLGRARREGVADADAPQLTRFSWPHAIVKVHHHALAAARQWLPRIDFAVDGETKVPLQVTTLRASGTIKALTEALKILQVRGEPERPSKSREGQGDGTRAPARRGPTPAPPAKPAEASRTPRTAAGPVAPPRRRP